MEARWAHNPKGRFDSEVSQPQVEAEIWADSDNGSTVALQASGRGSIPRRSTLIEKLASTVE